MTTTPEAAALAEEALKLADVLRGMTECGAAPDDLWERDQPDGDPFVARAAELLRRLAALAQQPAKEAPAGWKTQLKLIYDRLLAGDFYEDYDRATKMVGWLQDMLASPSHPEQPQAAQVTFESWATRHIEEHPEDWPLLGGHDGEKRWALLGWDAALSARPEQPKAAQVLPVREFQEWLDENRDARVSEVFHDIVANYRAAISARPEQAAQGLTELTEDQAAALDKAFERMRQQRDDLKRRLFEALDSDPILKEGLQEVDNAIHINRMTYSRVLDVACAQKARADELEAQLYARPAPAVVEALRKALSDAAQSLETINKQAGNDEFMLDLSDVRSYAASRALAARAALQQIEGGE